MRSHLYRLRRSVSDPIFSFWFSFKVSPVSPMSLVSPVFPVPIAHPPASEAWFVSGAFLESWMFRDSKNIWKWHSYFLFSWGNFCWTTPSNWKDTLVEELIVYFHFDPQNNITEHLSSRGPSHQLKRRSGSPSGPEIKEWKNSPCTWEKIPMYLRGGNTLMHWVLAALDRRQIQLSFCQMFLTTLLFFIKRSCP